MEIFGIVLIFLLSVLLAIPIGRYMARVYAGEKTLLDFIAPIEQRIYKICGIDPNKTFNWKQNLVALLTINLIWFIPGFFILLYQGKLPFNPDGNPSMSPDLAFNSIISFVCNTNLQDYSGESGATYFTQVGVFMFLQFVSAAVGMSALVLVFNSLKTKTTDKLGNFFVIFTRTITRILLPLSIILSIIFIFRGMPSSFDGKEQFIGVQGDTINVSRGPVAQMVSIKQLGTNGGGYYGANSAHPLENPDYFTNIIENWALMILPISAVFALGFYIKKRKLSYIIFGVMTLGFLCLLIPSIQQELAGNPALSKLGISQVHGSMEGKEVRIGTAASAFFGISTTVISCGAVNAMHDSMTPISGMNQMLGMMVNCFYGGKGVGLLNYYIFLIIAVFLSGLMVGRTPEFMGKKIEAKEMKIASLIALLHPFLILSGTAIATHLLVASPKDYSGWLSNPGFHGFSEMLYQFTSSSANNGSAFGGLNGNSPFWNISTGFVILFARFLPIIGPVAIAGILAQKKFIPESTGTLKTDTVTFGAMTFAVIVILAALAFFPALALGPISEYFTLAK